jgi:TonB-dependent SusC/RagA subfamily outer membrane receptor
MKYALSLWIVLLLLLQGSAQRPELKRITGKVVSATTGRGLPDITLILKRSGKQATTNMQGIFSVALSVPDTLVIRHISYKEQRLFVSSENNSPLFILLEENTHQLDEVIVNTGYQSVPKERATGSFTQIDSKLYNEQVGTNALNRLEYITNGLSVNRRINSNGQISIRGLSTIQGPQDPLIVVDNFPYNGDINNINANDIETVTILKDAAASSIWGAKAGNGVIVITTKKGSFNQRSKIDLNTNITIVNKPDLFYLPNISSGDFIDVEKYLFDQGYRFDDTLDTYHKPFSPVYEILFKERNGEISAADASSQINAYRNHDVRNDFNKYFYQKAVNQQYALNVQGGSNTVAYILSAAYDHNSDNLAAGYNRVSIKSANTFKITPSLQIDAGVIYTYSKTTNGKPAYDGSSIRTINGAIPPYTMLADAAGNALPLYKDYRQTYTDTAGGGKLLNWNYYPLTDYMFTHTSSVISDVVGNLGFRYKLNKDLSIEGKYQYERQTVTGRTLYDQQSYYTRNLINTYSQPDYTTGQVTYIVPLGAILDLSSGLLESHQARGQLNYNKSWGNNSITAIAGGEIRQAHTTSDGYRTYGYDDNILTSVNVDAANTYPNFVTGNYDYIPTNASFSDNLNRFVSVYANAAYTWLNRYTLSASARRDASNIFGVNTNNKWSPLWSLGSSWEISREKFYASALLPYLKARLTYGFSGNVDPNLSAVTTISYLSTSPYTQTPFAQVANFYNPILLPGIM